ncbi:MAG: protein translocase subunit SecF [Candidatus Omnitrophica bacterium]|nr:protein translocase subunit SecF [Candidatus Omnitrophota bacterium]MCM8802558.1 protein translocase subunit SecF [Candidatus Omnitrophota bacterium]
MELIKTTNFNFMGKRKFFYFFSLLIIIFGIPFMIIRGEKNFGVDFVGGDLINIEFNQKIDVANLRKTIAQENIGSFTVQELGTEGKNYIIRLPQKTSDLVLERLKNNFGENFIIKGKSIISPSMSISLRKKAIKAFLIGLIGILIYLTIRFEFKFAVGAVVALFHDILVVLSILVMTGKQIDGMVIAALLTIIGYSVNDTVVVFDRIRENARKTRTTDYIALFNKSINETLSRTILTGLTTIFVVLCLFFFGGESLHTFSFCLLLGIVFGTYSSIFIASAIVVDWLKRSSVRLKI